jgi:hypothetical protein
MKRWEKGDRKKACDKRRGLQIEEGGRRENGEKRDGNQTEEGGERRMEKEGARI